MSISAERNDVKIERLFNWGNKFSITDIYGNSLTDAFIRLVGDAEINKARTFAIRKSAELRKKLKDENSDERVAFISTIYDNEDPDEIIETTLLLFMRKFYQEAYREVRIPLPKEPKAEASLEEIEEHQKAVDEYDEKRNEVINQYVADRMIEKRTELSSMLLDHVRKIYEKEMVNELCEREMINKFKDCCTYFGSYSDPNFTVRTFASFDEFDNVPTEIKQQYLEHYNTLEINVDELKKSLEATQ